MVLKSDMLYNIKCAFKYSLIWYLEHSGSGRGRVGRTKGAQSLRGCETGEQSEESPLDDFCIPTWGIVTPPHAAPRNRYARRRFIELTLEKVDVTNNKSVIPRS